ncbi:uncharacterized protein FIESC28_11151 [Fusarium coffeatum]|uniref:F-box domain-containing protein n=1 Tax=Fusarium coffeatum TaxID=231269 RepID=A0A366QPT5_9HYPO|nr:uncharacterized protein FIESC28_11151 [Fusarium coffeatum]RBR06136.1 hypothetical protein FIESC28_11151 [Fusarium coffeatum]
MATLRRPGYRSVTDHRFKDEDKDAIIRTVSYHREDFDRAVIWFSPDQHADVRPSIATPFPRTSNVGLGILDCLPPELLNDVLFRLDVHSLFKFRQTNLRSRQMVDSLKQYQMVVSHGLNLFCALLRTSLAIDTPLLDFYDILCTKNCSLCGEFGGFVSLLIWKRCCFGCIKKAPECQVHTRTAAPKEHHLTKNESKQLRSFKALPGKYTIVGGSMHQRRITVVSRHQTDLILSRENNSLEEAGPLRPFPSPKFNLMASCALPYYDKLTGKVENGIACAGCQLALERGIIGFRIEECALVARDKVHAPEGFLEHFRCCEQAQRLWESSCGGTKKPAQLPEIARRCGYFGQSG